MLNNLSPQRRWLLAIVAVILVNALVWLYGLSPALDKIEVARDELQTVEEQRDSLQQRLDQLNAIDIDALQEEMEHCNIQVPEQGRLRELITELEKVAQGLGLRVVELTIQDPTDLEPYLVTPLSLELIGQYSALKKYIIALEEHERLLLVDNFSLEAEDSGITITMDIVVFAEDFDYITPHQAPGRTNPFEVR